MDVEEEEEDDEVEAEDVKEEDRSQDRETHFFWEPAQSKCTWTFDKSHFVWKFTEKMPDTNSGHGILREPAQSKHTWIFHKSHFVCKFTKNWPDTDGTTSIKHRAL